jgi:16S rRNA (cytosine1402-N4)-methyltransferase
VKARERRHIPVLLDQVLRVLDPTPGQTIVDCTFGLGGHARELAARVASAGAGGRIIGIDFDPVNIANAPRAEGLSVQQGNFAAIDKILAGQGIERVDAILADLGVSSPQIDDPARGFSYRRPGPLDMRMDPTRGQPASALVNRLSEKELAEALLELGDETDAPQIARLIVERRKSSPIQTTQDLMAIVCEARDFTIQRAAGAKLHPAARTFQALRMLVNREIGNLQRLLAVAPDVLKPGGRIAIISFHSGEDRLVKKAFREGIRDGVYSEAAGEPVIATAAEIAANPRSRSAKLRWAVRAQDDDIRNMSS